MRYDMHANDADYHRQLLVCVGYTYTRKPTVDAVVNRAVAVSPAQAYLRHHPISVYACQRICQQLESRFMVFIKNSFKIQFDVYVHCQTVP